MGSNVQRIGTSKLSIRADAAAHRKSRRNIEIVRWSARYVEQAAPTPETIARTSPSCTGIGVGKVKLATEIVPGPVVTMVLRPTTSNLFAVVLSGLAITRRSDDVLLRPGLV